MNPKLFNITVDYKISSSLHFMPCLSSHVLCHFVSHVFAFLLCNSYVLSELSCTGVSYVTKTFQPKNFRYKIMTCFTVKKLWLLRSSIEYLQVKCLPEQFFLHIIHLTFPVIFKYKW